MRIFLIIGALLLCCPNTSRAVESSPQDEFVPLQKIALVVGAGTYNNAAALPGAVKDARIVADVLSSIGFDVRLVEDPESRDQFIKEEFLPFTQAIKPGAFVVFYFSGHGFTYNGESYLAPLSFSVPTESKDVFMSFWSASALQSRMSEADPAIVMMFLDACRDLPAFIEENGVIDPRMQAGLKGPTGGTSAIISYATAAGMTSEGSLQSELSPYTRALAEELDDEDVEFEDVQNRVRIRVRAQTADRQNPWVAKSSSLEVYFKPSKNVIERFRQAWQRTKTVDDVSAVKAYLEVFALGPYGNAARKWMADLSSRANTFTQFSPAQIDAAWDEAKLSPAVIPRITGPFGLPRIVTSNGAIAVPSGAGDNFTIQRNPQVVGNILKDSQNAVVLQEFTTRLSPNLSAAKGVTLGVGSRIAVSDYEFADDGKVWLKASSGETAGDFYLPVPVGAGTQRISIGKALSEFIVSGTDARSPSLVDEAQIDAELQNLRDAGRRIDWISVSAPAKKEGAAGDEAKAAALVDMQAVDAYAVIRTRIPPGKVSLLLNAPGAQLGARVRIFGE
ncbi:caspase domain-containing protein [Rhizobium leguminosarum]|uniref:caspase family protein n=1 Tax=Rhizobium leguminosarum TaxID=384 RepID=UPI001C91DDCF|nr:caspase family protein [Rhizobium leguminosarum]MBY2919640.1 caspase family protein [Rhizobium leguminosarum]MBY2975339.1 caspase family protein [Rhizobium leguminosarum]MBY2981871.1 caspase family protein [Rhizobium leguminosarum]MBY3011256.1 caspase family protein [Rhizobium leguminosarum]